LYKLAQIAFLGVETLIMCPLELARKRLFAQRVDFSKTNDLSMKCRIETRAEPYSGVLSCLYSVTREEGGAKVNNEIISQISKDDWRSIYGNGQESKKDGFFESLRGIGKGFASIYRGFWPRYLGNIALFISNEIKEDDF
jgi:hypothetical protein